jgi:hypothetical protein
MDPEEWSGSSYNRAASLLEKGEFTLERNVGGPLTADLLRNTDVLVLLHPCDSKWERTTSPTGSPTLDDAEIGSIIDFVKGGEGCWSSPNTKMTSTATISTPCWRHSGLRFKIQR